MVSSHKRLQGKNPSLKHDAICVCGLADSSSAPLGRVCFSHLYMWHGTVLSPWRFAITILCRLLVLRCTMQRNYVCIVRTIIKIISSSSTDAVALLVGWEGEGSRELEMGCPA